MDFSEALKCLKDGMIVTNENWNGKGMYLFIPVETEKCVQIQDDTAGGTPVDNCKCLVVEPYIMMSNANGNLVPWTASQMDLFSDGWVNTGPY